MLVVGRDSSVDLDQYQPQHGRRHVRLRVACEGLWPPSPRHNSGNAGNAAVFFIGGPILREGPAGQAPTGTLMWKPEYCALVLIGLIGLIAPRPVVAQRMAADSVKGMLAAQIRTQGFACDEALKARRDSKRSRPDLGVWVLQCNNATYRISRAPDMSAKVEPLR